MIEKIKLVGLAALAVAVLSCSGASGPRAPEPETYMVSRDLAMSISAKTVEVVEVPGDTGEVIVLDRDGQLWQVSLGRGSSSLFGDISELVVNDEKDPQYGLLSFAFSPGYPDDQRVYLIYTAAGKRTVLSRFLVVEGRLDGSSEVPLLEIPNPNGLHNAGRLAFGPDGYLYVSLGDSGPGGDPDGHGQNLLSLPGSILRLDVSGELYSIPADNPFVGSSDARPEVYAYGFRNPWRFSFDRVTGDLWVGDVGQTDWEEVNLVVAGGNYGWNIMEGAGCYRQERCANDGFIAPRTAYSREEGCAVIGGYVYRGAMPELVGWYVYGDWCTGKVWAVDTADDGAPILLSNTKLRIVSFGELSDGELLILSLEGGVYRLQRLEE